MNILNNIKFIKKMEWNMICYSDIILEEKLPGDKIRLPANVLEEIMNPTPTDQQTEDNNNEQIDINYPIIFRLKHNNKSIIVPVIDFMAEPNSVILPEWLMYNLYPLNFGEQVAVELYSGGTKPNIIPKGTLVKLRPHDSSFLEIVDHRTVLEHILQQYTILNKSTTITFDYCDCQFNLDIIETHPEDIIDIIDTDLSVDFDAPVDYVEPPAPAPAPTPTPAPAIPVPPLAVPTLSSSSSSSSTTNIIQNNQSMGVDNSIQESSNNFVPFSGRGYKLGNG